MKIKVFLIVLLSYQISYAGVLKSIIYDFDGLDVGQSVLPEGDYGSNGITYKVAANTLNPNGILGDRVLQLNMNWSASSTGTFGKAIGRYVEIDPLADRFNFYFLNPLSNNQDITFDVVLTEDDDKSETYDNKRDDSWIKNIRIAPSGSWQLISIPIKDFIDANNGGNGIFDAAFTVNKGMLLSLEFRFSKNSTSYTSPSFFMDMLCLTEGTIPYGQSIYDLPLHSNSDYCRLGAFSGETNQKYLIPSLIENLFSIDPSKKLKYINWYIQFAMDGSTTPKELPGDDVKTLLDSGYTPIITWEAKFTGYDNLDPVQPKLLNISNGTYDSYINSFADKIKSYNDTVIIRFMHEFNGNWYPWSIAGNGQNPAQYITAFRHTVDRFKARGATKVKWMWCANTEYTPYKYYNWMVSAYPGDSYVDIVAIDVFNNHYPVDIPWWLSFRSMVTESYYYLTKYFPTKPLFIVEQGCRERTEAELLSSENKSDWLRRMNFELQSNFSKCRGLVFYSNNKTYDWRINSSDLSLKSISDNIWNEDYYFNKTSAKLSIALTYPAYQNAFPEGSSIWITSSVSKGNSSIKKVEFFANSTKIGEDTLSPFSCLWNSPAIGNYLLKAVVTDKTLKTATSSQVPMIVKTNSPPQELIPAGSTWKYLDNGSNQGTAWRTAGYNDANWKSGSAQFGYGDGDEATLIKYGSSSSQKYITTYFRKSFVVNDISNFSGFEIHLLRDDGAVVYVNGKEVFRSNMPSSSISASTLALAAVDGSAESVYNYKAVNASDLITGNNLIAVEIHQASASSSDMSFNLKLIGNLAPPACSIPSALKAISITSSSATLTWQSINAAASYDVQYRKKGTMTWSFLNTTSSSKTISGLSASTIYEYQVRSSCSSMASAYSAISTFTTSAASSGTSLITAGSSWKYLDNGSNQGAAWRLLSYNDGTWKTGNTELGYGDGGEATVVSYGSSSSNKYITTYFRKTFNITDKASIAGLELSLIKDDGAVVYINGTEVHRTNLPPGAIYYNTLASDFVDGTAESTFETVNISSSSLVNGTNIIAVEVHQNSPSSSDQSFNLKLKTLSGSKTTANSENNPDTPEIFDKHDIVVYPNPTTGTFSMEFCLDNLKETTMEIKVTNSLGQIVYETLPHLVNGCIKESMDLDSKLPVGIYILQVTVGEITEIKRMLLTK